MCAHYQSIQEHERYRRQFGVEPPPELANPGKCDVWPGYSASFIRHHPHADTGDDAVPLREALPGLFGLIPHWSRDATIARRTYNARSETVAEKPSFRDAWKNAQHCIIPVDAFFEPDWRSGKAIATRIAAADGQPLGIAGLWAMWRSPQGPVYSFTMLTINADGHDLMRQFHKPADEKRMVVIVPPEHYDPWLRATPAHSMDFMRPYPAQRLHASVDETVQQSLFL